MDRLWLYKDDAVVSPEKLQSILQISAASKNVSRNLPYFLLTAIFNNIKSPSRKRHTQAETTDDRPRGRITPVKRQLRKGPDASR